jgi:hypothetical protein
VFALKNNGGFQEDGASPYSVGTRVLARYARGSEWFPGMVTKVVSGGLMSIAYDDGGKETRVSCMTSMVILSCSHHNGLTPFMVIVSESVLCRCMQPM